MATWTADSIRQLRKRYGLSQADLAKLLRITPDGVQHWEQERGNPSGLAELALDHVAEQLEKQSLVSAAG